MTIPEPRSSQTAPPVLYWQNLIGDKKFVEFPLYTLSCLILPESLKVSIISFIHMKEQRFQVTLPRFRIRRI